LCAPRGISRSNGPAARPATAFPHNTALQVLLGSGGSNFQAPVTYPIQSSLNVQQVVVADVNRDSKQDALAVADGKLSMFAGNGGGIFQAEQTIAVGGRETTALARLQRTRPAGAIPSPSEV
jgi:hypothetical protein